MNLSLLLVLILATTSKASSINADSAQVSNLEAQPTPGVIVASSAVYITLGSSLTMQGAGGIITTASSMTASAFFGDPSHLTGIGNAVLVGTQVFSGADTFASNFTIQSSGRQIILSTSSSENNLSIDSGGHVSFYPQLHSSSSTVAASGQTGSRSLGWCVGGSTITLISSGGRIEVSFVGDFTAYPAVGFLQDGQFVDQENSTTGIIGLQDPGTPATGKIVSFSYLVDSVSAGAHSYCLTFCSNPAEPPRTVTLLNDSTHVNQFYAVEIK